MSRVLPGVPEHSSTSDGWTSLTLFWGVNLFSYLTGQTGLERVTRNGGLTDRKKERKMKGGIKFVESVII